MTEELITYGVGLGVLDATLTSEALEVSLGVELFVILQYHTITTLYHIDFVPFLFLFLYQAVMVR